MWPVPQNMRSLNCPVCKTTEGDRYFCDLCETQFCGFCSYPKHHRCRRKGDPRPATTSKATSPALGAQHIGRASRSTPLPMPPPQRKPIHVLKPGMHPNSWQHDARESAKKEQHGSSSCKKQDLRGGKPRRRHSSKDTRRSPSTELEDLKRPLSSPRSSSPSREQVPRPHQRVHKTHKAQHKAPLSSAPQASGTTE